MSALDPKRVAQASPTSAAHELTPVELGDGRIRVVIERITPMVDGGRFPIKRVLGDRVEVEADCFADGHDVVACSLLWRHQRGAGWHSASMLPRGNDRWRAEFVVDTLGSWEYTVRAWVDPFLSWRHDFERRVDAEDLRIAARTGALLIEEAAQRAELGGDAALLRAWAQDLERAAGSAKYTKAYISL